MRNREQQRAITMYFGCVLAVGVLLLAAGAVLAVWPWPATMPRWFGLIGALVGAIGAFSIVYAGVSLWIGRSGPTWIHHQ